MWVLFAIHTISSMCCLSFRCKRSCIVKKSASYQVILNIVEYAPTQWDPLNLFPITSTSLQNWACVFLKHWRIRESWQIKLYLPGEKVKKKKKELNLINITDLFSLQWLFYHQLIVLSTDIMRKFLGFLVQYTILQIKPSLHVLSHYILLLKGTTP